MIKSVLSKNKKIAILFSVILTSVASLCFIAGMNDQDWLTWGNKCLAQSFDPSADVKIKKWELVLTDDSFIRLRKIYQNGKQEYFSFYLQKLEDMDYIGNVNVGILQLRAKADDIIVQTYNDRQGNVDSMANVLTIPVKNMEPERLDSLRAALNYFKAKNL
ncbi:MAG: hypothetical protein JWQ34_3290 [Mucilaginibacter sp.]|uniref:hypothetical protein n=1 Tax=Mucilaginibacter sp. TaxID=1882438 RepID=UPI0026206021|nr:hypothetical protein [Mucilaginibacter sp.]MDB5005065.1 hypothetical protein [Mucilaginibacter sp.]